VHAFEWEGAASSCGAKKWLTPSYRYHASFRDEEEDKQLLQGGLGVDLGGLGGLNVGVEAGRKLGEGQETAAVQR